MPRPTTAQATRWATNVSLPTDLLDQLRALGLNVPQACEGGLKAEIVKHRAAQWLEDNRDALASSNDYVGRHGLLLAEFRQF